MRIADLLEIYTKFKHFRLIYEQPECLLKDITEKDLGRLHNRLTRLRKKLSEIMKQNSWNSHPLEEEMKLLDDCFNLLLRKGESGPDRGLFELMMLMEMVRRMEAIQAGRRQTEVETCLMLKRCTYIKTAEQHHKQEFFHCITCGLVDSLGVCGSCAEKCHKGHTLSEPKITNCYCDCIKEKCLCRGPHPDVIKSAEKGDLVKRGPDCLVLNHNQKENLPKLLFNGYTVEKLWFTDPEKENTIFVLPRQKIF